MGQEGRGDMRKEEVILLEDIAQGARKDQVITKDQVIPRRNW